MITQRLDGVRNFCSISKAVCSIELVTMSRLAVHVYGYAVQESSRSGKITNNLDWLRATIVGDVFRIKSVL